MTFGIIPMALFWFGLVWFGLIIAVVLLIHWSTKEFSNSSTGQEKPALDVLKERFTRGEIDKQEFEEVKHILTDQV